MSNKKELFEAKAIMKGYEDSLRKTKHQQSQITELKEELARENKSHNYHCKESQRKNDVIDELKELLRDAYSVIDEAESLFDSIKEGDYIVDSFTAQPCRLFKNNPKLKEYIDV